MGFQGSLKSYSLADLFQNIGGNARTGTLKIGGPRGEKIIYFADGLIRLLAHGPRDKGLLRKVLVESQLVAQANIEEAEKMAVEKSVPFINVLLEKGLIEEENFRALVNFAIEEDIYDLFTWEEAQFDFIDGPPENELFEGELIAEENAFNTSHLVMEAARRSDEWGRIRQVITSDENVFTAINENRNQLETFEKESIPLQVVLYVDGYKCVGEVIKACGLGKFDVYEGLFRLYQQGIIRHKTFEELFQTGVELKDKGQHKKAIVFLRRALDTQMNTECLRAYAELFEITGEIQTAGEQYFRLAQEYARVGDEDSALEVFHKVSELDPHEAESHAEIANILAARDLTEEAVAEYILYAEKLLDQKNIQKSREICYRILNLKPDSYHAHRILARGYLWEGNSESAIAEYKSLAQALLASMKPKQAIKEYSEILDKECNFPAVKEGVKDFLLKSGQVKSYGLMRFVLTLVILIILGAAGLAGFVFWKEKVRREEATKKLGDITTTYKDDLRDKKHKSVIKRAKALKKEYHMYDNVLKRVDDIIKEAESDLTKHVDEQVSRVEKLFRMEEFVRGAELIKTLNTDYGQGYGFLDEQLRILQEWDARIVQAVAAGTVGSAYQEAVKQFEQGLWEQARAACLNVLLDEKYPAFSKTKVAILRKLSSSAEVEAIRGEMPGLKDYLKTNPDIQEAVKGQLQNALNLYGEILEAEFDGDKVFKQAMVLKKNGADPDIVKKRIEKADELGSREARKMLRDFDENQARELQAEAIKLEHQGDYEKSLRKLIYVVDKYPETDTAGDIKFLYLVQTNPDGVNIDVNERRQGVTESKTVYRYKPDDVVKVRLHYPSYKTQSFEVTSKKAVYRVQMAIGPERTFRARAKITSETVVVNDTAYFGDERGYVYSLNLEDFTNDWDEYDRQGITMGISGTPFVYRDTLYFGNERGGVIALNRNSAARWANPFSAPNNSEVVGFAGRENPIKMAEYLLFVATKAGNIYAVDAETGEPKWDIRIPGGINENSGIFVFKTTLFAGSLDGGIYGVDIFSHNKAKRVFEARKSILSDFTLIRPTIALFGCKDFKVYAIDISNGVFRDAIPLDNFPTRDWLIAKPHVVGNDIYIGSQDHSVYGLTFSKDKKITKQWSFLTDEKIEGEVVVIDGVLYAASVSGRIYAIEISQAAKGPVKAKWEYPRGTPTSRIRSGLRAWRDFLLVSGESGHFYGFRVK